MPETAKNITRFRKNLKQFISLKEAGKLNGQAAPIEEKLKGTAQMVGLDFEAEMEEISAKNQNTRKNPIKHSSPDNISDLVRKSLSDKDYKSFFEFGEITSKNAEQVKREIGIEVEGYKHVLESDSIRHIIKQHGDKESEMKRGQIVVTEKDFTNLPQVFNNPDKIIKGDTTKRGLKTIIYEKEIEGRLFCVEEVRTGRKKLAVKTIYKHRITGPRANSKERVAHTPKTSRNHGETKNTKSGEQRENPVEVPFTITLNEINKLHSIRSIKKLNSYVGHKHPCYIAKHSGEKPNSHISFKYDPDYRNKKYTLDLLLDGKLEFTACAEGSDKNFTSAWKQVLAEYGDLTVEIRSQDHAKKVLGATEYRKKEKEQKNEAPETEKADNRYKNFQIGSKVKTVGLPEKVDGKSNPLVGAQGIVKHSQKNDVVVDIEGYGETGFLPKNLEIIESKEEANVEIYKPTFSQLATYLAFIRMKQYDYEERFTNRIEDYQKQIYLNSDKAILIFQSWHNREYDEDHTRWHSISRGGKYDTLYSSDHPEVEDLKPITVQDKISDKKKSESPAYNINQDPRDGKRVKINRSVLLREIILGKLEAARYKGFNGMTDSTDYVKKADIEWFNPAEDGFFWSRNFREFQASSYDYPSHYGPNEITLGDYKYRYKEYVQEPDSKTPEKPNAESSKKELTVAEKEALNVLPFYQREAVQSNSLKAQKESLKNFSKQYQEVPDLYTQDGKGNKAKVYIHIFNGGSDWYITELDKETMEGFGYAILNGDTQMAEMGYINLNELFSGTEFKPGKSPEVDLFWNYQTIEEAIKTKTPESKESAANMVLGKETNIDFKADGSVSEKGRFALVESSDVVASHNKDCSVNSEHEISKAQPRNRAMEALCAQPKFIAKNLNPTSITVGNLAFNGTPVLTSSLQAIQGNGRSISMKIVYDELPKKAMEYRSYLNKNASDWGFTKQQVGTFSKPVLVRILDVSEKRAIELGNIVDTSQAKLNKVDAAKAYVRNLPEGKRKIIGDIINDSNGETLGEIIDDKGLKIFDQFKDLDRSDLVESNKLTSEGKDFLRSVFAGLVFDSEDRKEALQAFLNLPHNIKAGLERSYGHMIPFVGSKADITPETRGAVIILDALKKRPEMETIDELFSSVDAFEGSFADKFTDNEKALAEFLNNTSTQKEIRDAFRMYQYFITGKEDLFNPIEKTTPQAAFIFAFVEKHRLNPMKNWTPEKAQTIAELDKNFYEILSEKGIKAESKEAADLWTSAGFKKRFKEINKSDRAHKLKVRIQRLQSLGDDNSKEIAQLNELIGKDNWEWNEEQTQIEIQQVRDNPQTAKFIFLGVLDKLFIDQGKKSHVELQGPHSMLTNKSKNKIFIVPFSLIRSFDGAINDKKAEEVFEEWNNYEADQKDMTVTWPDDEKALPVGTAKSIFYISDKVIRDSDKKGKINIYHHDFDEGKRPAVKKGNILIVSNLEINERGILN